MSIGSSSNAFAELIDLTLRALEELRDWHTMLVECALIRPDHSTLAPFSKLCERILDLVGHDCQPTKEDYHIYRNFLAPCSI